VGDEEFGEIGLPFTTCGANEKSSYKKVVENLLVTA